MGSLRARALALVLLLHAAVAAVAADQGGDQRQHQRAKREAPVEAKISEGTASSEEAVTADVVQTALHAWLKLRDGANKHAARRRSTSELETSAEANAGAKAGAGADRVRVSEFSFTAESSFTAVSRALDRLANRSRGGAPIAATEFVVEGSIDKDTIQSYLRSHAARGELARAEEDALRKVVGMLLKSPAHDNASATTAKPPRRLVARAAPPISQSEPDPSPTDPLSSPRRHVGRPGGTFRGRFLWSLDDDGYDDDQPSEGLPRRMPPLYVLPPAETRKRGGGGDDDDDDKAKELNVDEDNADDVKTDDNAEDYNGDEENEDDETRRAGNPSWNRRNSAVEEGDHVLEDGDGRNFVRGDASVKHLHFGVPADDDETYDEIGAKDGGDGRT